MAFINSRDYVRLIQDSQIEQLTGGDDNVRLEAEKLAVAKVKSYLSVKYDLTEEFRDIKTFTLALAVKALQTIELDATAYANATAYVLNDLVSSGGIVYICIQAGTGQAPASSPAYWTAIGTQYGRYYINAPYSLFNYKAIYDNGDFIFRKDNVYKCLIATNPPGHDQIIQYAQIDKIPTYNVVPETQVPSYAQWSAAVPYSVTGLTPNKVSGDYSAWSNVTAYTIGNRVAYSSTIYKCLKNDTGTTPGTDITVWQPETWVEGDARNPQLVDVITVISTYYMHRRISPRNIPQLRVDDYNNAILWLEQASTGVVEVDIPKIQPYQGHRIKFGGNTKNQNTI